MGTFKLNVDTGNAAFDPDPVPELARLLRETADKLEDGGYYPDGRGGWLNKTIFDVNGNDVGRYSLAVDQ